MRHLIILAVVAMTLGGCGRVLTYNDVVRGDFVVDEQAMTVESRQIRVSKYRAEPIIAFWAEGDGYRATTDSGFQLTTEWRWYESGGQWFLEKVLEPEPVRVVRGPNAAAHMVPYIPGEGR